MTQKYNIAVAGATGAVGTEIVQILEQRDFPIDNLYLLASSKSKGKKVEFKDIDPPLIDSRPARHFKKVVLPEPLSPRKEISSPFFTEKVRSFIIG